MKEKFCRFAQALTLECLLFFASLAQQTPTALDPSKSFERDLRGGESHSYLLTLAEKRFIHLKVAKKGINMVITVFGPDDKMIVKVDSRNGDVGEEQVYFITDNAGRYRIRIDSLEKDANVGRYVILLAEVREPTSEDEVLLEADSIVSQVDEWNGPRSSSDYDQAAEKLERAAELYGQLKLYHRQAVVLAEASGMHDPVTNYVRAIKDAREALEIFQSENDNVEMASVYRVLGNIYYSGTTENNKAGEYFKKAADIRLSIGDKRNAIGDLNGLALSYREDNDFERALSTYQTSLGIAEEIDQPNMTAATLGGISDLYRQFGNFAKALEFREKALADADAINSKSFMTSNLLGIATVYEGQGNDRAALEYCERDLNLLGQGRNGAYTRARVLDLIGEIHLNRGEFDLALDAFNKAASVRAEAKIVESFTPINIGNVRYAQGRYDDAIANFQKAFDDFDGYNPRPGIMLANSYGAKGEWGKALNVARSTMIRMSRVSVSSSFLISAYTTLGKIELMLGKFDESELDLRHAISLIEIVREQIAGGASDQTEFFNRNILPYNLLVQLLVAKNEFEPALEMAERSKARTLLDTLRNGTLMTKERLDLDSAKKEQTLRSELTVLNKSFQEEYVRSSSNRQKLSEIETQLEKKRLEFEAFYSRLSQSHPDANLRSGRIGTIRFNELSDLVRNSNEIVLEFVVTEDKTTVFSIATRGGTTPPELKTVAIGIGFKELSRSVEVYRSKLAGGDLSFGQEGRALYDKLIKPVTDQLRSKSKVLIVPDGPLWNLPFQALIDEKGKYLAEKMAVSYAPSLTALREMQKKARERKPSNDAELVAFGNPTVAAETEKRVGQVFMDEKLEPLPEAERLVNTLAKMYGPQRSKVYTGAAATEETAKTEAPKYRIVQFATHGILNDISPMYSHLVLAQDEKDPNEDGLLEAWELKDLDLKADMVILSACDTARGKISNGEGIIGMTWAAFIAGAPTTVASQWKVESSSTTELMLEFHRQLLSGKVSKAEALRRAQIKLMRNPKYKHPSYWAAWVIVGDAS